MKLHTETIGWVAYPAAVSVPVGRSHVLLDLPGHITIVSRQETGRYRVALFQARKVFSGAPVLVAYCQVELRRDRWGDRWVVDSYVSEGTPPVDTHYAPHAEGALRVATGLNAHRAEGIAA